MRQWLSTNKDRTKARSSRLQKPTGGRPDERRDKERIAMFRASGQYIPLTNLNVPLINGLFD